MGTVSVWDDENVLEMDGGEGDTTLSVLRAPELCTYMVDVVHFMGVFLSTIKTE